MFHSSVRTPTVIMSITITLNNNNSVLNSFFLPPIELGNNNYECALIYFKTFNSIPNVDSSNNLFHYDNDKVIEIPEGSYELDDIFRYLNHKLLLESKGDQDELIDMEANTNTLKCTIHSKLYDVHFEKENSIGSLLGFSKKLLKKNVLHISDKPINILITNTIRVECNITEGSFVNDKPSHVIHEFSPTVPPGYQIIERPSNPIYVPLKGTTIQYIQVRIVNEHDNLVNFRDENISLRLHIRKAL